LRSADRNSLLALGTRPKEKRQKKTDAHKTVAAAPRACRKAWLQDRCQRGPGHDPGLWTRDGAARAARKGRRKPQGMRQ